MPKISSSLLEEINLELNVNQIGIEGQETEKIKIKRNEIIPLTAYSEILSNLIKEGKDIYFEDNSINDIPASFFKQYLNDNSLFLENININDNTLTIDEAKEVLDLVNNELKIKISELRRINRRINNLHSQKFKYMANYIKSVLGEEALKLNSEELSNKLTELNNSFKNSGFPEIPFDIDKKNIENLQKNMKSLSYFKALLDTGNEVTAIENLRHMGVEKKFYIPLENLSKIVSSDSINIDNLDKNIVKKYIDKLGVSFTEENFRKVENEISEKITDKKNILKKSLSSLIDNLEDKEEFADIIETIDKIDNSSSSDITEKVILLTELQESLNVIEIINEDLKNGIKEPIKFPISNKYDFYNKFNAKLKISNLAEDLSDEELINNIKIYLEIFELSEKNKYASKYKAIYEDYFIEDLNEIIFKIIEDNKLYKDLEDYDKILKILIEKLPILKEVDDKLIFESLNNVNSLEFLNERNSQYKNFNEIILNFKKLENFDNLSPESKEEIKRINSSFENASTDELYDLYNKISTDLDNPAFTDLKLAFNDISTKNNPDFKPLELHESQKLVVVSLKIDSELENNHEINENVKNSITDIIFYELSSDKIFLDEFKRIVNDTDNKKNIHTDIIFEETFKKVAPDIYDKVVSKISIKELIDNFNSIGFATYKLNKEDINIYKFLERETRNEDFVNQYNTILSNNPDFDKNKVLFETFSNLNPVLLKKLRINDFEDFKNIFPNNYNFDYFRNIARSSSNNFNIENEPELKKNLDLLIEKLSYSIQNKFINKYPEEFSNSKYYNQISSIYKVLTTDDPEFIQEIETIKKELNIDKDLLKSLRIENEKDFYFFYINDKDLNLDIISIKQNEIETLNYFKIYETFLKNVEKGINNGSINVSNVDLEAIKKAVGNVKNSNINMNKEKLNTQFLFDINVPNTENYQLFEQFKKTKEEYDIVNSYIEKVKSATVSPRRFFGINNSFIKLSFDEDNNKFLQKITNLEEKFDNVDLFDENVIAEINSFELEANNIQNQSQYQFIFENLKYILDKSKEKSFFNSFKANFNGTDEEAEIYFNMKIKEFQQLSDKVQEHINIPENVKNIKAEISDIKSILSTEELSDEDTTNLSNKLNELNNQILEMRADYENFVKTFSPAVLHDIYKFQKKTYRANKLENNLFIPHKKLLERLNNFQVEQELNVKSFSELSDFLTYEDLTPELFKLKLKELLDRLVKDGYFKEKEVNLLLEEFSNKKDSNSFNLFKESIIEYKNELEKRAFFANSLVEHLSNENISTADFIKEMKDELDDMEILGIISLMKSQHVIGKRAYEKALFLFDLDGNINTPQMSEENENTENNQENKYNSEEASIIETHIQGFPPKNGSEVKWGSASKILFDEPYSNLLNDFKQYLNNINPKILEELENGDVNDFSDLISIKQIENLPAIFQKTDSFKLINLLRQFLAEKIMSDYPNHNLSNFEIHEILFNSQNTNYFFHTQMKKTISVLEDGFKNDLLKSSKEKQTSMLSEEINDLVSVESSNFQQFQQFTDKILEEEKNLKEKKAELDELKSIERTLIASLEIKGISSEAIESSPEIMSLRKDMKKLNNEIIVHNNNINELNTKKNNASNEMDSANSLLIQKRKLLSQMNTSSEDSERAKNLTLAQRLYMFGDDNKLSNEEILNMSPEDMRNKFLADKDALPLTEVERLELINKEEKEAQIAKSIKDEMMDLKNEFAKKTPFINPLSQLNRNMEYLGYRKSGLSAVLYNSKISSAFAGKFLMKTSKPFLEALAKDMIKSAWIGHSKNAAAGMGKITGLDLTIKTPTIMGALNFAKDRILLKEEMEALEKKKSEAPKIIEDNLEKILEQIKYSKSPNSEFSKVLKNPLINDIMNPKKRSKFKNVNISNSVLDKFRESMYKQLRTNLKYNINSADQKKVLFQLFDTMNPSLESIKAIINDKFIDFSKKGIQSPSSSEYIKLINIMKTGSPDNDGSKKEGEDSSFTLFKSYLREYIGEKTKKEVGLKKEDLFKETVEFQEKLKKISNSIDKNSHIYSIFYKNILKFNEVFEEHDPDNKGIFKNPLNASKDAHIVLVNMFQELSDVILEELRKNPENEELALLLKEVLDFKVNISDFKKSIVLAERVLNEYEEILENSENENKIKEDINNINSDLSDLSKENEELHKDIVLIYENISGETSNEYIQDLIISFLKNNPIQNISKKYNTEDSSFIEQISINIEAIQGFLVKQGVKERDINFTFQKISDLIKKYLENIDKDVKLHELLNQAYSKLSNNISAEDLKNIRSSEVEKIYLDRKFVTGEMKKRLDSGDKLEDIEKDYLEGKYDVSPSNKKNNETNFELNKVNINNVDITNLQDVLHILDKDIKMIRKSNNGKFIVLDRNFLLKVKELKEKLPTVFKTREELIFLHGLQEFLDNVENEKIDISHIQQFKKILSKLNIVIKNNSKHDKTSLYETTVNETETSASSIDGVNNKHFEEERKKRYDGVRTAVNGIYPYLLKLNSSELRKRISEKIKHYTLSAEEDIKNKPIDTVEASEPKSSNSNNIVKDSDKTKYNKGNKNKNRSNKAKF